MLLCMCVLAYVCVAQVCSCPLTMLNVLTCVTDSCMCVCIQVTCSKHDQAITTCVYHNARARVYRSVLNRAVCVTTVIHVDSEACAQHSHDLICVPLYVQMGMCPMVHLCEHNIGLVACMWLMAAHFNLRFQDISLKSSEGQSWDPELHAAMHGAANKSSSTPVSQACSLHCCSPAPLPSTASPPTFILLNCPHLWD